MLLDGQVKHFLQLGTVMTEEAYQHQGLSRRIMEEIQKDYQGKVDGIYLFGNDNVLEFYPKFGFVQGKEYLYSKKVGNTGECQMEQIVMDNADKWKPLLDAMGRNIFRGKFDMINNNELIMFYVTKFMKKNVYYHKDTDTYVIAEVEGESLFVHNVFSGTLQNLDEVISLFGENIKKVTLGFTPLDENVYDIEEFREEDCTFFILGEALKVMEKEMLRIPTLAHA